MQLLTKSIKDRLVKNFRATERFNKIMYEDTGQEDNLNHKAVVKLFNPSGVGTWYLSELNPDTNVAFGLCELHEKEFGYVSLDELTEYKGMFGLGIERDRLFKSNSKTLEELLNA